MSTTKPQFKMYLPDDVIEELARVAEQHGKKSAQEVVKELIRFYLPVWKVVNSHINRAIRNHTESIMIDLSIKTPKSERLVNEKSLEKDTDTAITVQNLVMM